jgi:hypothetical protein
MTREVVDANYEHIAAYGLLGGSTALRPGPAIELIDAANERITLASALADALDPLSRSEAIRGGIFSGGAPKDAAELDSVTAAYQREAAPGHATFLICRRRGHVEMSARVLRDYRPEVELRIVDDDRGARSEVLFANAHKNALVVDLICCELDARAMKVHEGVRFLADGVEIVPLHFTVGLGSFTVSHVIGQDLLAKLRDRLPETLSLRVSSDVAVLLDRLEAYEAGHEPLAAMANFCLTLIEVRAGGRANAAKVYGITKPVLNALGRLVSEVGDHKTGRKATANPRSHTESEKKWIVRLVRLLILRASEIDLRAAASLPPITMATLPPLS